MTSTEWLTRFYFGSAEGREGGMARAGGLKAMVESRLADIDAREINSIPIGDTPDGQPILVRVGRYGPYVTVGSGEETTRASLPDDLAPDELTVERALELLSQPSGDRELGIDPATGEPVTLKIGRYGPYIERGAIAVAEPVTVGASSNGKPKKAAKSTAPGPPGPACSRPWTPRRSRWTTCCRCSHCPARSAWIRRRTNR